MSLDGDGIHTPREVTTGDHRDGFSAAETEGCELASEAPVSEFPAEDEHIDQVRPFLIPHVLFTSYSRAQHLMLACSSLSLSSCGSFCTRDDLVERGCGTSPAEATQQPLRYSTAPPSQHSRCCMRADGVG